MVSSFMEAIFNFMAILDPSEDVGLLDEYCTGMTFGLSGSKVLVSIANIFMGKDGKLRSKASFDIKGLEESLYRTA